MTSRTARAPLLSRDDQESLDETGYPGRDGRPAITVARIRECFRPPYLLLRIRLDGAPVLQRFHLSLVLRTSLIRFPTTVTTHHRDVTAR
jgi:hypothetical protein